MRNEELEARINKEFQEVFSHGDAHRNKVLGLESLRIDWKQIEGIEDSLNLLSRNILEFLNMEFPRQGMDWCRIVCDLKMQPIRERLEWAKRPWQP